MTFYKKSSLRVSIAETLSTVSKAKARSATLWGRVEKLRAFVCFYKIYAKSIINLIDSITLNTELNQESEQGKLCLMQIYFHATFLINSQHTQRGLFHFVQRFPFVRLDQGLHPRHPRKQYKIKIVDFLFVLLAFKVN